MNEAIYGIKIQLKLKHFFSEEDISLNIITVFLLHFNFLFVVEKVGYMPSFIHSPFLNVHFFAMLVLTQFR